MPNYPRRFRKNTRKGKRGYRKPFRMYKRITNKYALGRIFNFKRSHGYDVDIQPSLGQGFFGNSGIPWTAGSADAIQLDDLPNYAEFTALFDSYRITGVKVTFNFSLTVVTLGSTTTVGGATMINAMPMLYWIFDQDDPTVPATLNVMREYESFRCRRLDKPFSIFFRPKCAGMIYNTPVTTAYSQSNSWIDCSNADVDYYGAKFCIDPVVTTQTSIIGKLRVDYTYYMQFKQVR